MTVWVSDPVYRNVRDTADLDGWTMAEFIRRALDCEIKKVRTEKIRAFIEVYGWYETGCLDH